MYVQVLEIEYKNGTGKKIKILTTEPEDIRKAGDRISTAGIYNNAGEYTGTIKGRRPIVLKVISNLLNKESKEIKTVYQY